VSIRNSEWFGALTGSGWTGGLLANIPVSGPPSFDFIRALPSETVTTPLDAVMLTVLPNSLMPSVPGTGWAVVRNNQWAAHQDLNNAGDTWRLLASNLPTTYGYSPIGVWTTNGRTATNLYLEMEDANNNILLWRAAANGASTTWYLIDINRGVSGPLPTAHLVDGSQTRGIFVNPWSQTMYVQTDIDIRYSTNAGITWTVDYALTDLVTVGGKYPLAVVAPGLLTGSLSLAFSREYPGAMFAASAYGRLLQKTATGAWQDISYLLPTPRSKISSVAVAGGTNVGYVGLAGRGILQVSGLWH
jgi:hypothetical protein